jgi:DNA-directed RNA polymerase specialized sigma subunit
MILSSPNDNARATPPYSASDSSPKTEDADGSLEETARREEDYVRERLRGELGRDPSDEELREWLREHTEGY